MAWEQPTGTFNVDKPKTDVFAPSGGWNDVITSTSPWSSGAIQQAPVPAWQSDEALKKQFGIELAKAQNPFEAACKIAGEDTAKALWISSNWLADPVVIAAKDVYLKTVELSAPPLDREQLAAKVLALADEKVLSPKLGCLVPTVEAKDRIAAFKLYSEILGYTGKVEIDNSTKTFNHNEMTIKLVRPQEAKPVVVNQAPNTKSEIVNESPSPITLKLVGGISR